MAFDLFSLIISLIVGNVFTLLFTKKRGALNLEAYHVARHTEKERWKQEILGYLKEHKRITNNDVEHLLGVADVYPANV
jgi:hypothetical protein